MSDVIAKLTNTAPELILMFLFALMFLKAMAARDQLFVAAVKEISQQHVDARESSRKVIEENSTQTLHATRALTTMTEVLRELKDQSRKERS